ncbi:hypothetical protein F751_2056 [Auxenochlorella protothecoides]|uniref:Sulfotransferase n=1 Tax=Auxenochlorella protothecoides TaxID=3075 RepID=A0A087SML6_AUXPR|nr:hypothetical protein F751_2056 [Auxenochlorella protothecoides]KFM26970.1 hypothetical protein F751_2056 [Auxenochlorella protothecoides]
MERQDALTLAALPLLGIWLLVARILSMLTPLLAPWLSYLLAQRLYYATPFAVYALRSGGGAKAILTRLVVRRYLTLPLRPHLPHFYIVGFPKCGTTSMCTYLKQHPCIDGLDGLPYHEILEKWVGRVSGSGAVGTLGGGESHFYVGALGRSSTTSTSAYRSFFPTIVASTLARVRHGNWLCFDACPVHACLPHVPARMKAMTPNAKLVFMMRDPLAAVISGELMLRDLGMPLQWSTLGEHDLAGDSLAETEEDSAYWAAVEKLPLDEPLPADLMQRFYSTTDPRPALRAAKYADCLDRFLRAFPKENMMFVDFADFVAQPEATVRSVLKFVGADAALPAYAFKPMPPGMQGKPRGRTMHPAVKQRLRQYYRSSNLALQQMLGRSLSWFGEDV